MIYRPYKLSSQQTFHLVVMVSEHWIVPSQPNHHYWYDYEQRKPVVEQRYGKSISEVLL